MDRQRDIEKGREKHIVRGTEIDLTGIGHMTYTNTDGQTYREKQIQ